MDGQFRNKIVLVAGGYRQVVSSIVRHFLLAGATVIVPATSAGEIAGLKKSLANISMEKLVTLLTDYPDYYKAFNIAETIMDEFGTIDIAVFCFNQPHRSSLITETDIIEWEKMIEEDITAYFISARIVFNCMKSNHHGMFVSICREDIISDSVHPGVAELSSLMQRKMALMFHDEFKEQQLRFYHILLMPAENSLGLNIEPVHKYKTTHTNNLVDYILQLYNGETEKSDNLFHSFLENDVIHK